jgi:phosphohistidine phosphatase
MGKFLAEQKKAMPSLIITSPANRAFKTAKKIARKLKYPEKDIQKNPDIYEAGVADLLKVVQALDDKYDSVMITGHNPGMTSFVNFLCRAVNFDNMPTCSVCRVDFDVNSWGETDANKGKMIFFEYPRDYNP